VGKWGSGEVEKGKQLKPTNSAKEKLWRKEKSEALKI